MLGCRQNVIGAYATCRSGWLFTIVCRTYATTDVVRPFVNRSPDSSVVMGSGGEVGLRIFGMLSRQSLHEHHRSCDHCYSVCEIFTGWAKTLHVA